MISDWISEFHWHFGRIPGKIMRYKFYNSQILNWLKGIIWIIPKSWRNNQQTETLGTIVRLRLDVKIIFIIALGAMLQCLPACNGKIQNGWWKPSRLHVYIWIIYIYIYIYNVFTYIYIYIYSIWNLVCKWILQVKHVPKVSCLRKFEIVLESPAGQLMWLHRFRDRGKHSYSKATGLQPHYTCTPS